MVNYIKRLFGSKNRAKDINRDTSNIKRLEEITGRLELVTKKSEVLYNRRCSDYSNR